MMLLLSPRFADGAGTAARPPASVDVGSRLLILAVVVLGVARLAGMLAVRLGQPRVVGEIVAGLCLGPSLLGLVAPRFAAWLLPTEVMPAVTGLAELGLVAFL